MTRPPAARHPPTPGYALRGVSQPLADSVDLAIIIVSYNVRGLLRDCLASVFESLAATPSLQAVVWVVDNASADDSAEMVQAEFPQVRLLASERNLGFAGGNNLALRLLGLEQAAGEDPPLSPRFVLLLNPDTVVQEDALAQMVIFLESYPEAGGCGARLSYPDGRFQHSSFRFPGLRQILLDFFPPPGRLNRPILDSTWNGRYSRRLYMEKRPFAVDFMLGAVLMVRAEAVRQVGLLDEGYFMYCEEMDWQKRLWRAGWSIFCLPSAHVVHHEGASAAQFRGPMFVALWRSRLRYFCRYHGDLFNWLLRQLVRLGVAIAQRRDRRLAPPDLAGRLAAYRQVAELARS